MNLESLDKSIVTVKQTHRWMEMSLKEKTQTSANIYNGEIRKQSFKARLIGSVNEDITVQMVQSVKYWPLRLS